ncbi:MAG TPA: hypothetical protein VIP09_10255 [Dehalococcoidia bacterium]|jgi:hypothetical protein
MDDYLETNRKHWDELAGMHSTTEHYDVGTAESGEPDGTSLSGHWSLLDVLTHR